MGLLPDQGAAARAFVEHWSGTLTFVVAWAWTAKIAEPLQVVVPLVVTPPRVIT